MTRPRQTERNNETSPWNVLIIDDNQIDAFVCQRLLETANVVDSTNWLSSANDGLDFIGNRKNTSPSVIFLDLQMPVNDGFYFLEQYAKKYAVREDLPGIVVLTSFINNQIMEKIQGYPFVFRVIEKPLDIDIISELWNEISSSALSLA